MVPAQGAGFLLLTSEFWLVDSSSCYFNATRAGPSATA
jgi:hypothetical protein